MALPVDELSHLRLRDDPHPHHPRGAPAAQTRPTLREPELPTRSSARQEWHRGARPTAVVRRSRWVDVGLLTPGPRSVRAGGLSIAGRRVAGRRPGVVAVTVVEQHVGLGRVAGPGSDLGCPFAQFSLAVAVAEPLMDVVDVPAGRVAVQPDHGQDGVCGADSTGGMESLCPCGVSTHTTANWYAARKPSVSSWFSGVIQVPVTELQAGLAGCRPPRARGDVLLAGAPVQKWRTEPGILGAFVPAVSPGAARTESAIRRWGGTSAVLRSVVNGGYCLGSVSA
jgi:hypothetical protein